MVFVKLGDGHLLEGGRWHRRCLRSTLVKHQLLEGELI